MRSLVTFLLGFCLALALGVAALWYTTHQQGTPWPPEWLAKNMALVLSREPAKGTGRPEQTRTGTRSGTAPTHPPAEATVRFWGPGFRRRDGWALVKREDYERKFAITVGVNAYSDPGKKLADLGYAVNDAREFREILTSEFGYAPEDVLYLSAERQGEEIVPAAESGGLATKAAVEAAFTQWLAGKQVTARDAVIMFFAGHGWEANGEGFIGLSDTARERSGESAIAVQWVKEQLARLPAKTHRLVILDCCYSGTLFQSRVAVAAAVTEGSRTRASAAGSGTRAGDRLGHATETSLADYLEAPAFLGMSAGRFQPVGDLAIGGEEHSPFTRALLKVLRERANSIREDHAFTFRQLAAQVEGQVAFEGGSIQIPDWGRLEPGDGDFVFRIAGELDSRRTPREERLHQEGLTWLDAARASILFPVTTPPATDPANYIALLRRGGHHKVPTSPQVAMFAAKSVGFRHFGRPDSLAGLSPEEVRFWTSEHPSLLGHDPLGGDSERLAFYLLESEAQDVPVWASPVGRHHHGGLSALARQPEPGKLLASGGDGFVRLWRTDSGALVWRQPFPANGVLCFGPGGRLLAGLAASEPGWEVYLWDVERRRETRRIPARANGEHAAVTFRGEELVWAVAGEKLTVHRLAPNGDGLVEEWSLEETAEALAFHPDKPILAVVAGALEQSVKLWDYENPEGTERRLPGELNRVRALAFSGDGCLLAAGERSGRVLMWNLVDGSTSKEFRDGGTEVTSLAFDRKGQLLLSGHADGALIFRDLSKGDEAPPEVAREHGGAIHRIEPDFATGDFFTASTDQSIGRWDSQTHHRTNTPEGHWAPVTALRFQQSARRLVSSARDETVRWWDLVEGRELARGTEHSGPVSALGGSADGAVIVSAGENGRVLRWETSGDSVVARELADAGVSLSCLAMSRDGSRCALGFLDGKIDIRDAASGQSVASWQAHDAVVKALAFGPDGSELVSGEAALRAPPLGSVFPQGDLAQVALNAVLHQIRRGGEVRHWDAETGRLLKALPGHASSVSAVVFDPRGRWIASAGGELTSSGEVFLWDLGNEYQLHRLPGHDMAVEALALSPDGKILASGGIDRVVYLWDVDAQQAIRRVAAHDAAITSLAFSPDGCFLATASENADIRVWALADAGGAREGARLPIDWSFYLRKDWCELSLADRAVRWRPSENLFRSRPAMVAPFFQTSTKTYSAAPRYLRTAGN